MRGVLVVQHVEPREFSANEVRTLVAVAAQIAVLVTNAHLTREIAVAVHQTELPIGLPPGPQCAELQGTQACSGFGQGTALRYEEFDFTDPQLVAREPGTPEEEQARLVAALCRGPT